MSEAEERGSGEAVEAEPKEKPTEKPADAPAEGIVLAEAEKDKDDDAGAAIDKGAEVPAATDADKGAEVPGDKEEPAKMAKQEEPDGKDSLETKPSNTLRIGNLPKDMEVSEMEMRLKRFGEVVSIQQEDDTIVAKFARTNEAYQAREKLNGIDIDGSSLRVTFGPQEADHYNRGRKRGQKGLRDDFDSGTKRTGNSKVARGMRAWTDPAGEAAPVDKGAKADDLEKKEALDAKPRPANFGLTPPSKPVSRWSIDLSFEQQLEDFMKMPRRGMYNRYLVLGKLPPELRTGEAIWRLMHPVQRDIVQIEMLMCFGKPVAHVSLRSATAAAAMHRLCEQIQQNLTVAFAPPRRASATLWLGNVDDFVPRKELESLLGEFGRLINGGMRYLPARTCAFATFSDIGDAVLARNTLYGLEVQRNQFLNVDFVEESDTQWDGWGWGQPPWMQQPWWSQQQQQRGAPGYGQGMRSDRGRREEEVPARGGLRLQSKRDRQQRSRTRSRGRSDRDATPPVEKPRKRHKRQEASPPARVTKQRPASDSEEQTAAAPPPKEAKGQKNKVKLYKMREFCCNIVANYVKGRETTEPITNKLHIDQRTKIEHCRSHMERAGALATVWHLSAADRKDCPAYDALCDYFVEKQRVGLVQTPAYYVYIVPPTEKYLKELSLPTSNFVVGLQIPIKKVT